MQANPHSIPILSMFHTMSKIQEKKVMKVSYLEVEQERESRRQQGHLTIAGAQGQDSQDKSHGGLTGKAVPGQHGEPPTGQPAGSRW